MRDVIIQCKLSTISKLVVTRDNNLLYDVAREYNYIYYIKERGSSIPDLRCSTITRANGVENPRFFAA